MESLCYVLFNIHCITTFKMLRFSPKDGNGIRIFWAEADALLCILSNFVIMVDVNLSQLNIS